MNITKQHPEFIFVHKQARLLFQIKLNITAMAKRSVLLLLVSIAVVSCSNCEGDTCSDTVNVPLITKLSAPLEAKLDISKLTDQLKDLISQEVTKNVADAIKHLVDDAVDKRLQIAENTLETRNNATILARLSGKILNSFPLH